MKKIILTLTLVLTSIACLKSQVKVGDNPNSINANSLLELESTNKGFLPPRVALNNLNSTSPLSGATPVGMIVYSLGGTLANGLYEWNGIKWQNLLTADQPYASVTSNITQVVTSTTTATVLTFEINEILSSITHSTLTNTSRIIIQSVGTYFLDFSAQLSGGAASLDIWLRKNGVDVPMSNTRSALQNSSDYRIIQETFIVSAVANDYFELVLSSTNTSAGVTAIAAGTSPTRPISPSINLKIWKLEE